MARLNAGDRAPEFELENQHGNRVTLSDFRGRKLLLFFYPRAETSGCTKQATSVRDARSELADLGVDVLGISPDSPQKQKKFDAKHKLGFSLLSDADKAVARSYGAWGEKSMYGKKYEGVIRSSLLVDEKGKVVRSWYKVSPQDTVPKAYAVLQKGAT
jgi:peroxiredoxin Q/BCP